MENIVDEYPFLSSLKATGLERSAALKEDLDWFVKTYPTITIPPPGPHGPGYSAHLRDLAANSMPKFICHYYNHMFAHTAGGRMIGKSMATKLLDSHTLKFYEWEGDVKELGKATVKKIDAIAAAWTEEERQMCLEETGQSFMYSGALMVYLRPPAVELNNMITYA
jgi:heme oxygenase